MLGAPSAMIVFINRICGWPNPATSRENPLVEFLCCPMATTETSQGVLVACLRDPGQAFTSSLRPVHRLAAAAMLFVGACEEQEAYRHDR